MTAARAATPVAIAIAVTLAAAAAEGRSSGITGHSGKGRQTCNAGGCHSGGERPDASFAGPDTLAAGATASFRFTVVATSPLARAAGLNVAADAGAFTAVSGQGARVTTGELTHNEPKDNDGARTASWEFLWTAPAVPGRYRLYGAGNSVNRNGQSSGDRADITQYDVQVVAAADTATPTATPTATAAPPSPTPTATAAPPSPTSIPPTPSATASETALPTATASPSATAPAATPTRGDLVCPGSCADRFDVTISDLITAIAIALGQRPVTDCRSVDQNRDGVVSIAEIVTAVNNALSAC